MLPARLWILVLVGYLAAHVVGAMKYQLVLNLGGAGIPGPASGAMLLRGTVRFAFFAVADRWRHFARCDGVAYEPQQSGRAVGKFGGPYYRFHVASFTRSDRRAFGAGRVERTEPKGFLHRGLRRVWPPRPCRDHSRSSFQRADFRFASRRRLVRLRRACAIYPAKAERDVARSEHERDRAGHVHFSKRAARGSVRVAFAVSRVAFRVAAGEIISGRAYYASGYRRARSRLRGAAAAVWLARRVGRCCGPRVGRGRRRRRDCRRNFCAGYRKFLAPKRRYSARKRLQANGPTRIASRSSDQRASSNARSSILNNPGTPDA